MRNTSIAFYFRNVLDEPPDSEWLGKYGTIHCILKKYNIPKKTWKSVKRVLLSVNKAKKYRLWYSGQTISDAGRPIITPRGSTEENIIASWMDDGLDFRNNTIIVNEYRTDIRKEHVGRSAITKSFVCMRYLIKKLKKDTRVG